MDNSWKVLQRQGPTVELQTYKQCINWFRTSGAAFASLLTEKLRHYLMHTLNRISML